MFDGVAPETSDDGPERIANAIVFCLSMAAK